MTGSGDLYFADALNNAIREINATSNDITSVAGTGLYGDTGGGGPATEAELAEPTALTLDSDGDILVPASGSGYLDVIREIAANSGVICTVAGDDAAGYSGDGGSASSADMAGPTSIALDSSNSI